MGDYLNISLNVQDFHFHFETFSLYAIEQHVGLFRQISIKKRRWMHLHHQMLTFLDKMELLPINLDIC